MPVNKKIPIIAVMVAISIIMATGVYFLSANYKATVNQNINATEGFNQTAMLERGNVAMGFNQTKIHHHFMSTTTGGEIMIMSTNMNDVKTIDEIKNHLKDIQHEFSQGNFTRPFYIHAQIVPGIDIMNAKKNLIDYSIKDIDGGSVLILTTNDTQLLHAIQQFMDFQSSQHMGH